MRRQVLVAMILTLLLGLLGSTFKVENVEAGGTIYIRADGSIDGPANITTADYVTYYFNESNYDVIVVERDNIIIDGADYTLQGTGSGIGLDLTSRSNVTIRNMNIRGFDWGIWLVSSSNNIISRNNITNNNFDAIDLRDSSNNTISGNNITNNNAFGIRLHEFSIFNAISGNNITNTQNGIALYLSSNNTISGNNITANNYQGIRLYSSSNYNTISGNNITNNDYGIDSNSSNYNSLSGNNITNSWWGIILSWSSNNAISGNNITNNNDGILLTWSSNNTIPGNNITNNGNGIFFTDSSNHNIISGSNITNNDHGVRLFDFSNYNTIYGNNITANNDEGVVLYTGSSNNTISGNNITANNGEGVILYYSSNNTVSGNNITNNGYGINSDSSNYNAISGNNITNNGIGVSLYNCSYYTISGNSIAANNGTGITLGASLNTISGNNITNNNLRGIIITGSLNTISGNNITNNPVGIIITGSLNTISGNNITNNNEGIELSSSLNIISGNNITNNDHGIRFVYPFNNTIFHNNFVDNTQQVDIEMSGAANFWDDGYPSGGNYWSDYTGVDLFKGPYQNETGCDGIGDVPYVIDGDNRDNYPLMEPYPDTTSPIITILSPENKTYATTSIPLTFTVDECTHLIAYSLDGESKTTITGNTTLSGLAEGGHTIIVYANDTWGNVGYSSTVHFSVDLPPSIQILSPENKTYPVNDVPLTFTVNEPTDWIGYSLNGQPNVTIMGNTTLYGLSDGMHSVIVYGNDTFGNMGASSIVYFTIDTTPPNVTDISQSPSSDSVYPEDEVNVSATVTDHLSGVKQVILNYTNGNGTWITIPMTNLGGDTWNATIPPFPYCTNVTYIIMAEDNLNHTITTEEMGYEYQYHVIPESPSLIILPLFMIATLLALIIYRRKQST